MPTLLERHWPKLALLLTVSLLAGLLFVPALAQRFATPLLVLTLGMTLLLLALRHWRAYRAGKLPRRELGRNLLIETASLLLAFVLARFAGGLVAGFVSAGYGWLLGLLSALLVGAAAGLAVHKTLGRWVKGQARRTGVRLSLAAAVIAPGQKPRLFTTRKRRHKWRLFIKVPRTCREP